MAEIQEEIVETEEDTQKGRFLTFSLGNGVYAIEIKYVTEIIGIQPITEIPELPVYVKGIINLRGKIIPVLDVRLRFKQNQMDYNDRTCIIVVDTKEITIGLIVDQVSEVLAIAEENIVSPPELNQGSENKFVKEIGKVDKDIILILDCEKLVKDDDVAAINQIM